MFKSSFKVWLAALLLGLLLVGSDAGLARQAPALTRLSSGPDDPAITTPDYVFWADTAGPLYGYTTTSGATFTVSRQPGRKSNLASDNQTVAWVQEPAKPGSGFPSIQAFDLTASREYELIPARTGQEFGGLALAANVLYYKDATPGHSGLYSLDLASKQEKLISPTGQEPAASAAGLVWSEETFRGELIPSQYSLRLLLPGSSTSLELAQADGRFEVSLSDENVVWAALPPADDRQVYLYSFKDGQTRSLSKGAGRKPVTGGGKAAWVVPPASDTNPQWSAQLLDLASNRQTTLVAPGSAEIGLNGLTGSAASVAFTVYGASSGVTAELYLAGADEHDLTFNAAATPSPNATTGGVAPLNCGQVYKQGYYLYDCAGRWTVNGVQFILPGFGINGQTFYDGNYSANVTNGQVDYWLYKAADFLGAKNLRLLVDLPGDTLPGPTSPATLYDFALRANSLGMRLGLVLHNDTSWTLTPARKQWLSQLVSYFSSRNALSLIAYVSADNEINNHCGAGPDCYDNNATYVAKANQWTADFTSYVKSIAPNLLVTVGISSEKSNGDSQPAVYDFFRVSGAAPSLARSVDFLSPHNYGGGGYGIWPDIRNKLGYQGPIVLEEYGYPTDALNQSSYFKEGPAACRTNPIASGCNLTAPYFVETNARSIRENSTSGYAGGSAWMLADSNNKNCSSPSDFYTGLFASGAYSGCGGTLTTGLGQAKATGARIRYQYLGSTDFPLPGPSGLAVQAGSRGQLKLSWTDNSSTEQSFTVERKPAGVGGTWVEIGAAGVNGTFYTDTSLPDGAAYTYRVRAYLNGGYSAYSNEAVATTLFPAPGGLTDQVSSGGIVTLKWSDNTNTESGFRLERKTGAGGSWAQLAQLGVNATTYQDSTIQPDLVYYYRVAAFNTTAQSAYSNEATATVTFPAPQNLTASAVSIIQINLSWTGTGSDESGYRIERSLTGAANWTEIGAVGANTTAYTDIGLTPGLTYFYRVRASYGSNNSNYANPASAQTPLTPDFVVTNPDANAGGADSLSYAMTQAQTGQSILLSPTGDTITVNGPLPGLRTGVTIAGRCGPAGAEITLKGKLDQNSKPTQAGLILTGNTFYGVKLSGFITPQLKAQTSGSHLKCIKTE